MTAEYKLRMALAEIGGMVAALLAAEKVKPVLCDEILAALASAESEARAALSLPVSETREEWRVASLEMEKLPSPDHWVMVRGSKVWGGDPVKCEARVRIIRGRVIGETRGNYFAVIVSHWMDIPAFVQPDESAKIPETLDLIRQAFDKIPDFDPAEPKGAKRIP